MYAFAKLYMEPTVHVLLLRLLCLLCGTCRHGPARAAYIENFFNVVDWAQVSKNYEAAKAGKIQSIVE